MVHLHSLQPTKKYHPDTDRFEADIKTAPVSFSSM